MKAFIAIIFTALASNAFAQTCEHTDLSNEYSYKTEISRIDLPRRMDSCLVKITVTRKQTNQPVQVVEYPSNDFYEEVFMDCKAVRSFITGKNRKAEAPDNEFGDLIVADLNFDGKEDFAVKENSGGKYGGPMYRFYIQQEDGKFVLDPYLTGSVSYFPTEISKKSKTLIILVRTSPRDVSEVTHKLLRDNTWRITRQRNLPIDE